LGAWQATEKLDFANHPYLCKGLYKIDIWIFQKNYQALNRVICIAQEKYLKMIFGCLASDR
jgi:hypothetical protein